MGVSGTPTTTRPKITSEVDSFGGPISDCAVCHSHVGVLIRWKVSDDITQGYELIPCTCQQGAATHRERVDAALATAGLAGLRAYTFAAFKPDLNQQGYDAARKWAVDPRPPFLYLGGGTGTGKSHLLCAIGNHIVGLATRTVRYTTVPALVSTFNGFRNGDGAAGVARQFDSLLDADVLLLDDLGAERDTPYAQERVWQIIDYRYARRLPTAIASNIPRAEYSDRLASRLQDGKIVLAVYTGKVDHRLSEERKHEPDPWDA